MQLELFTKLQKTAQTVANYRHGTAYNVKLVRVIPAECISLEVTPTKLIYMAQGEDLVHYEIIESGMTGKKLLIFPSCSWKSSAQFSGWICHL